MDTRSRHLTMDVWLGSDLSEEMVEQLKGLVRSNLTVLSEAEHRFKPHGLTAVFILSESHFSIHTYPEERYLSIDCYVCNPRIDLDEIIDALVVLLNPEHVQIHVYERGHRTDASIE